MTNDLFDLFSSPEEAPPPKPKTVTPEPAPVPITPTVKPSDASGPKASEAQAFESQTPEVAKPAPKKTSPKKVLPAKDNSDYSAKDIEVLEGLEPVRRRPGMYIGGTDENAHHHLVAEVVDNSMDEAVAGHASFIDIELRDHTTVVVTDNGRGIPIDPHPKFQDKSALEVILTTLHSGGKFSGDSYETSGGLHGVGISVVNALSEHLLIEVARDRKLWAQTYSKGVPQGPIEDMGSVHNRRGTTVTFTTDPEIFGPLNHFKPARLFRMARSKAYLFRGVEIRWSCNPDLIKPDDDTPVKDTLHFPGGLSDYLTSIVGDKGTMTPVPFQGQANFIDGVGKAEWAVVWPIDESAFFNSYCNTVPTPLGGTHEAGFRTALAKGLRTYGEMTGNKQATKITAEDVIGGACIMLSVFISEPQFQGQTKDKLSTIEAARLVELIVRDRFDLWLSSSPEAANALLNHILERAEMRLKKRLDKKTKRQSATRRLRLPGKLSDCTISSSEGTELFIVEGDSAGGSAKQGRERKNQAILPLRGKILNVASATTEKMYANQELKDLMEALGCGIGDAFIEDDLRYEKIIIMTDADVDGAHIASLLMTFFYQKMVGLIETGHLYLALPPLFRISQGGKTAYAMDDADKDRLLETTFKGRAKIDISRFKGLGEMPPAQLRETTMNPENRTLLRVLVPEKHTDEDILEGKETARLVESLMGKKPELRFNYIQEHAQFIEVDV